MNKLGVYGGSTSEVLRGKAMAMPRVFRTLDSFRGLSLNLAAQNSVLDLNHLYPSGSTEWAWYILWGPK